MARVDPDRTVYIYGLHTESDDTVMYVGASVTPDKRRRQHISDAYLAQRMGYDIRPLFAWILERADRGDVVVTSILDSCKAVDAMQAESRWIAKVRATNPALLNDKTAPAYCNHAKTTPDGMVRVKSVKPGDTVFQKQRVYINGRSSDLVTPSQVIEVNSYNRALIGGTVNGTYRERWVSMHYIYAKGGTTP